MISSKRLFEGMIDQIIAEGSLLLPGFAHFESSYKSAEVDPIAGIIYPPSQSLSATLTTDKNPKSIQAMAKRMEIPFLLLEKYVSELTTNWKSKLDKEEIIDLTGLGRLYKEYDGSLKFSQAIQNQRFNVSNLPELQFKPLVRDYSSKTLTIPHGHASHKSLPLSKKRKPLYKAEYLPTIVGMGCFLLILGFYFLIPKQPDFAEQRLEDKVKAERINQRPSHQLNLSLAKDTFSNKNLADQLLQEEVETVLEAPNNSDQPKVQEILPKKDITRLLPKQATIITGAYKNYDGAKRKINKIIDLGFNPYQDKFGDLHRVGVTFPYLDQAELDQMLAKIRAQFSSSSWVLE